MQNQLRKYRSVSSIGFLMFCDILELAATFDSQRIIRRNEPRLFLQKAAIVDRIRILLLFSSPGDKSDCETFSRLTFSIEYPPQFLVHVASS